ncbi:transcriptional regulator, AlpA family [Pseudoxanthomonas sp. GM95]|uniref:helix-turn-helix transcriptional regulator n=1 Tax=Pseudoxanthomonas sp. GM95 TaxID=1881043 RepID=UPI0008B72C52|nr:AlpA family phage regulatory protein [Pseudoxanthomonas sp. GM95]SEL93383.1 transcriptional regulator, AlpA family [Pseudoxanthomonas sp. GM95]
MATTIQHKCTAQVPGTLPLPGSSQYHEMPQFPQNASLPFRRTIRRHELHQIVPLAQSTVYHLERRGEFPQRFNLTSRCVVWDLEEVQAWVEARKQLPRAKPHMPDVNLRKARPVHATRLKD